VRGRVSAGITPALGIGAGAAKRVMAPPMFRGASL
jgi:hypothetical protein